jgi:hypothetical protein
MVSCAVDQTVAEETRRAGRWVGKESGIMTTSCRTWWGNCALQADAEILAIDEMEDRIAPLDGNASSIRGLISALELCHHKADRWVDNILAAIGAGETTKGLGTRSPGRRHPSETAWQNACAALSAWCAGCPAAVIDLPIGTMPASALLAGLGERSPLKEWQVQRVTAKIRSVVNWARSPDDPEANYAWLLLDAGEQGVAYRGTCPDAYAEHEDFWRATARTLLHDTEHGEEADLSLALAIDMLWPCHWGFVGNLRIVLEAIGGKLNPEEPFAACGRNIGRVPIRRRMELVSDTLGAFCGVAPSGREADGDLLALLGSPTDVKRWLAASLDKTIRLQLDPPDDLRAMSALSGPEWIKSRHRA